MIDADGSLTAWIDQNWDTSMSLGSWWDRLADAGYAQPTWPHGLGGLDADVTTARVISNELAARHVILPPVGIGPSIRGPTILRHGNDHQRQRLRRLASGREAWCQLFSEPDAGSDLAGLTTRARLDGEVYIVNGQKVWNSSADLADTGMLLARTDPNAPKHDGISFFLVDMCQPGIEVRPLRTMNGSAQFCEVFLRGVAVPAGDLVGGPGNGWNVARTVLDHERRMAATRRSGDLLTVVGGPRSGNLECTVADLCAEFERRRHRRPAAMVTSAKALVHLAGTNGAADNAVTRDALTSYHIHSELFRLTNMRARARMDTRGERGPAASICKLALSGLARQSRDLGVAVVGAGGMLVGPDSASGGQVQFAAMSAPGVSIGGGTDEIQRNVIGERSLGLPHEPNPPH